MAIYNAVPPPPEGQSSTHNPPSHSHHPSAASTVDIEAWTLSALEALSVSPIARGTGTPLSIPIDDSAAPSRARPAPRVAIDPDHPNAGVTPPRRPPSRRDSMKRREAVLKGNEGSRQRRRWENDRLMHVPNVQPPLPSDWAVQPTHPVHVVPYQLAQMWDRGMRQRVEDERAATRRRRGAGAGTVDGVGVGRVPKDLHEKAKRKPALKDFVRVLEEPVRQYLEDVRREEESSDEVDSEDEEIVFVGRGGVTKDGDGWKKAHREVRHKEVDSGMVFDELGDDESGKFKRWLTHSISDYYGLASRSATVGKPPRRVVYVGIKAASTGGVAPVQPELPRPMWELF